MKRLDVKGNYELMEYDNGFFAIDYNNRSLGKTLVFSACERMVRDKFEAIDPELTTKENGYY